MENNRIDSERFVISAVDKKSNERVYFTDLDSIFYWDDFEHGVNLYRGKPNIEAELPEVAFGFVKPETVKVYRIILEEV